MKPVCGPPPVLEQTGGQVGVARRAPGPLTLSLWGALAGALALQAWRPLFFLTDDTLSAWLPVATEAYRRLYEGRDPLVNDYLFGGGYQMIHDPGIFQLLGPWMLLFSFLSKTPFYYLLPDVVGTLSLVTAAGTFCASALFLKKRLGLPVPGWLVVGLSLSYAFTPFNLLVGSSWIGFLSPVASYPVVVAAAFEPKAKRAVGWQVAAILYAILGGHAHPFLVFTLFSTLLVGLLACAGRRPEPLVRWAVALALSALVLLPLLWPALQGFGHTARGQGVSVEKARQVSVAFWPLLCSFVLGPFSHLFLPGIRLSSSSPLYNLAIAFSLVNLPLLGVMLWKRRYVSLEISFLVCAGLAGLGVVRPVWLEAGLLQIPLLRSLAWPFREIAVLQACTHLLFLVAYRGYRWKPAAALLPGVSLSAYALVLLCAAPTLWLFEPDRRLVVTGEAERYWASFRARSHEPAPRIAVGMDPTFLRLARPDIPFTLLGGYNFASLFRVVNVSGYSPTPPPQGLAFCRRTGTAPYFWGGVYDPGSLTLLGTSEPAAHRVLLTGLFPARWQVVSPAGTQEWEYRNTPGPIREVGADSPVPRLFYQP